MVGPGDVAPLAFQAGPLGRQQLFRGFDVLQRGAAQFGQAGQQFARGQRADRAQDFTETAQEFNQATRIRELEQSFGLPFGSINPESIKDFTPEQAAQTQELIEEARKAARRRKLGGLEEELKVRSDAAFGSFTQIADEKKRRTIADRAAEFEFLTEQFGEEDAKRIMRSREGLFRADIEEAKGALAQQEALAGPIAGRGRGGTTAKEQFGFLDKIGKLKTKAAGFRDEGRIAEADELDRTVAALEQLVLPAAGGAGGKRESELEIRQSVQKAAAKAPVGTKGFSVTLPSGDVLDGSKDVTDKQLEELANVAGPEGVRTVLSQLRANRLTSLQRVQLTATEKNAALKKLTRSDPAALSLAGGKAETEVGNFIQENIIQPLIQLASSEQRALTDEDVSLVLNQMRALMEEEDLLKRFFPGTIEQILKTPASQRIKEGFTSSLTRGLMTDPEGKPVPRSDALEEIPVLEQLFNRPELSFGVLEAIARSVVERMNGS